MAEQEHTRRTAGGPPKKLIPRTELGGTDRRPDVYDFGNRPTVVAWIAENLGWFYVLTLLW
jgi:hypothetical protein